MDPSFTQNPSNPLEVTYFYSASAVTNGVTDPSLPDGILQLYSDGSLACSIDVGGSVDSGYCTVTYANVGDHTIVTVYSSGTNSATETDIEDIPAVTVDLGPPTLDAVSFSYIPQDSYGGPYLQVDAIFTPPSGGPVTENYDDTAAVLTLTFNGVQIAVSPGHPTLVSGSPPSGDLDFTLTDPGSSTISGGFDYVVGAVTGSGAAAPDSSEPSCSSAEGDPAYWLYGTCP